MALRQLIISRFTKAIRNAQETQAAAVGDCVWYEDCDAEDVFNRRQ